jgi:hypothetical protein
MEIFTKEQFTVESCHIASKGPAPDNPAYLLVSLRPTEPIVGDIDLLALPR